MTVKRDLQVLLGNLTLSGIIKMALGQLIRALTLVIKGHKVNNLFELDSFSPWLAHWAASPLDPGAAGPCRRKSRGI